MSFVKYLSYLLILHSQFGYAKEVMVISHPFPPWQFEENGVVKGINIDLLAIVGEKLNINFRYKHQPWPRAWMSVKRAEGDAIISSSRKKQREEYLSFPPVGTDLWTSNYVFFVHSHYQKDHLGTYQDIIKDKLKVCVVNGYSYDVSFWQAFPYRGDEHIIERTKYQVDNRNYHQRLVTADNIKQCIGLLARHRVGAVIADRSIGKYEIMKLRENERMYLAAKGLVSYPHVLFSKGYSIAFVKGANESITTRLSEDVWSQLRIIHASGEYQKIVERWIK